MKKSDHPLYSVWVNMKARCLNKNRHNYKYYGALGVKVSAEWLNDFSQFTADMGPRPEGYTLDRIIPTGDYCKANCRWASIQSQNRNTRRARKGKDGTSIVDMASSVGLHRDTVFSRMAAGETAEQAITGGRRFSRNGTEAAARKAALITHCPRAHEYTPDNTYLTSKGSRVCKRCQTIKAAEYRAKKKLTAAVLS